MKRSKALLYAYPTSIMANQLGMATGCWYIEITTERVNPSDRTRLYGVFPSRDKELALRIFESLDGDVDPYESFTRETLKHN